MREAAPLEALDKAGGRRWRRDQLKGTGGEPAQTVGFVSNGGSGGSDGSDGSWATRRPSGRTVKRVASGVFALTLFDACSSSSGGGTGTVDGQMATPQGFSKASRGAHARSPLLRERAIVTAFSDLNHAAPDPTAGMARVYIAAGKFAEHVSSERGVARRSKIRQLRRISAR